MGDCGICIKKIVLGLKVNKASKRKSLYSIQGTFADMYPDLQHIAQSIFGAPMPQWLGIVKTFGLFLAIAFIVASYVLAAELKRKEKQGLLSPERVFKDKNDVEGKLVYPHERVGSIVMLALIGGIAGAQIFNAFETWQNFLKDPIGNLFSGGGLTFYGGLIVAGTILIYYTRKHKIDIRHFADSVAPALMLAYGIGRFGCHFSGDGDWGIFNSAYTTISDGLLKKGSVNDFHDAISNASGYFTSNFGLLENVRHLYAPAPSGLPDWLFANNFKHNLLVKEYHFQVAQVVTVPYSLLLCSQPHFMKPLFASYYSSCSG